MEICRRAALMMFLCTAVLTTVPGAGPVAAENRIHQVVKGDTLWDISSSYLYDPFLWPKVWSANRDVENPHLIYPGQSIVIPMDLMRAPRKVRTARPELPAPPAPPEAAEVTEPEPEAAEPAPMPEEVKQEMIRALSTYGFIIEEKEIGIGTLTSVEEKRLLIGPGQTVYVTSEAKAPLKENRKYSIVRIFDKVQHPVTGRNVGYLARILGDLVVVDVRDGLSTGIVGEVYRDVQIGDHIIEHIEYLQWLPREGEGPPAGLNGYVLINPEGKRIMGKEDVAFLDLGSVNGLSTGDTLDLIFEKGKIKGTEAPHEVIGKVQVVVPRETTSVVRLIDTTREITPGTRVTAP